MEYEGADPYLGVARKPISNDDMLRLLEVENKVQTITIRDVYADRVVIEGIKLSEISIVFDNCKFDQLKFSECEFSDLELTKTCELDIFRARICSTNYKLLCDISDIRVYRTHGALILEDNNCGLLSVNDIIGTLILQKCTVQRTHISGHKAGQVLGKLHIVESQMEYLEIRGGSCKNFAIDHCKFTEEVFIVDVILEDMLFQSLNLDGCHVMLGDLRSSEVMSTLVQFCDCNMGETTFDGCDFETMVVLEIDHSNFEKCKTIDSKWTTNFYGDIKNLTFGYFEIRKMFLNSNQFEQAEEYWSLGMTHYFKQERRQLKNRKTRSEKIDFWVKIGLPWFTSRFGQSFALPLKILILTHICLTLFLIAIQGRALGVWFSQTPDLDGIVKGIELWAYTILPTHKLSFNGGMISPIISLVMRIVSGVLIYQMVLASRKHIGGK